MNNYIHKVQYYETDKMGVTHHSNYIRFMEEARTYFLEQIGYPYKRLEDEGVMSPVIGVSATFKKTTTYNDEIEIEVGLLSNSIARCEFEYKMTCRGEIVCTAVSQHCFLDKNGRPISLKRTNPQLFELLEKVKKAE